MKINLRGKVALVTGGSGGIGEAVSLGLGKAGASVAVHYYSNQERAHALVKQIGSGSQCFQADLANPDNARALFASVISKMGKVDVLINNAGMFLKSPVSQEGKKWLDDWEATLALNLTSAAMLCHAAVQHFMKTAGGRIINIASRAAFRGETAEYLAYAASKGGLVSLSRSIARSFGKYNIKSFVVAPGLVRTRMIDDYVDERDIEEIITNELALTELTQPDDVAPTVIFIASGMMDHATGCTIDINAGSYMR
jgi:3-oxoacyl-[acyl-carrier protein] reductase